MLRNFGAAAFTLLAAAVASVLAVAPSHADDVAGEFDFYVLALSWSPSYCASEGPRANKQQCGTNRPFGFLVHGLWPQNEWGYPANCQFDNARSRGS